MRWLSYRLAYFPGKDALDKKKYAEAEEQLTKAAEAFPIHPDAGLALAEARWRLGKKDEARKLIDLILEKDPEYPPAHYLSGIFSGEEGDLQSARASFEKALEGDPKNSEAWYELGKVLARANETGRALHAFRLVAEADPFITAYRLSILKEKQAQTRKK